MAELDTAGWTGEGLFTQVLIDHIGAMAEVAFVRVENAPASRSDADYNFISNEIYIAFATQTRTVQGRRFGILPTTQTIEEPATSFAAFTAALACVDGIGAADYADETMVQYLRTERVIPPYQTRGYKMVELVRVYEVGTPSRANA